MIRNPRQLQLMRLGLPANPVNAGGGGGNTTSNTVSTPWTGQQPYLSSVFGNAQNAYNQYASNPASSVAGFTPQQQQAMSDTQNIANQTNLGNVAGVNNAAGNYTTNLLNGAYLNSNPANSMFSSIANSPNNPYTSSAMDAANSAITRAYQTATAPQTTSQFEGSGRYGSGAMMNAQSQNQQDLATQLGNTDAGLANTMYQQGIQNQLAGAQGLSNNYNTAMQQMLAGSANAPNVVNSINGTVSNLYNMGGNQQAYNQSVINAPWQLLNNYSNLIQGQYGGNTSTTTPYYQNQMAGALGGALGGAALGGLSGSSYGTGIGAGLGALAGAYSDRRLKLDIEATGVQLDNGLPLYHYRYVWDAPHVRRFGVMADEVREIAPHAVHTDACGFDMVNYDAIGGAHVLAW
jgi:hypothetical protein